MTPTAEDLQRAGFGQASLPHERRIEPLTEVERTMSSFPPDSPRAHLNTALRQVRVRERTHLRKIQFRVPPAFAEQFAAEVKRTSTHRDGNGPLTFASTPLIPDESLTQTIVVENRP